MITSKMQERSRRSIRNSWRLLCLCSVFILAHCSRPADEDSLTVVARDSATTSWYKKALIYTLDVEVFKDSDGDGTGDFDGLISRLDYLDSLGIDAIWLAPFQPTPNKDDGYDVSDFYRVDPRLGNLEDFNKLITQASRRNIKILMDLVVNHTSDEHPWFRQARSSKTSNYRDWYTWSTTKPENYDVGMVFPGVQESIWTRDCVSNEYYYHRFFDFQPDLNMQNDDVQREVKKIITFWMKRGVKGFRLDAVPFFIEVPETKGDSFDRQFELLTEMRALVDSLDPEGIILGEANVMPKESKDYFGERGKGINMMFNFYVNQHLFYALATGDAEPLSKALDATHAIPATSAWGQFIRNHDEVDLGRLTDEQRNEVYEAMGPQKDMQLYDRGIRRRLAPMLGNDRRRLELAYSMLFGLPSTPVIRYGDEIGMGDDLSLPERLAVRTPMQWSDRENAGFTSGQNPVRPVIDSARYSYRLLNVARATKDSASLLNWTRRMIDLRQRSPEIAYGKWEIIDCRSRHLLAVFYTLGNRELLLIHNFSPEAVTANFKLPGEPAALTDEISNDADPIPGKNAYTLSIDGYGYRWFRLNRTPRLSRK